MRFFQILVCCVFCAGSLTAQNDLAEKIRSAQQNEDFALAAKLYGQLIASGVDAPEVRSNYGVMLYLSHQNKQALEQLQTALRYNPNLTSANLFAGLTESELGRWREALPYLSRAERADPNNEAIPLAAAKAYVALRDYQSANAQYRKTAELNPKSAEAWYGVGVTYRSLAEQKLNQAARGGTPGNTAEAKQLLDQASVALNHAIELDPSSARAHLILAESMRDAGDFLKSLEEYQKTIKLDPQMEAAYLGLATGYWKMREFEEALPRLKHVLANSPDDPEANGIMADILEQSGDHANAKHYAEAALRGNPDLIYTRVVLARIYLAQQQPKLAIEELQRVASADLDGTYHYLLYRAYLQAGNKQQAQAALAKFQQKMYTAPKQ